MYRDRVRRYRDLAELRMLARRAKMNRMSLREYLQKIEKRGPEPGPQIDTEKLAREIASEVTNLISRRIGDLIHRVATPEPAQGSPEPEQPQPVQPIKIEDIRTMIDRVLTSFDKEGG
jgi:hypothetical protein